MGKEVKEFKEMFHNLNLKLHRLTVLKVFEIMMNDNYEKLPEKYKEKVADILTRENV